MTQKQLLINKVEPVLLFGTNDSFIRKIDAAFPNTRITARGNEINLAGDPAEIGQIERVIHELSVLIGRNDHISENDVGTVLDLVRIASYSNDAKGKPSGNGYSDQNVLLYSPDGTVIKPKTEGQKRLVETIRRNDITFAIGPAGTGKTYLAVAMAVAALKARWIKRIVLCRPAVEAGESLGFLPGDMREKIDPYLRPLYDALEDMMQREKLSQCLQQNIIEIVPLAYMRGRTLSSAYVILDEAQNATTTQMKMFLTRLGNNSRAIITGDITQTDLPKKNQSGLIQVQNILKDIEGIGFSCLQKSDVVRHHLVQEIIEAYEKFEA